MTSENNGLQWQIPARIVEMSFSRYIPLEMRKKVYHFHLGSCWNTSSNKNMQYMKHSLHRLKL